MDIKKTRSYYENKMRDNVCQCDYCQNFIDEVKGAYPEIAEYLSSLGVNRAEDETSAWFTQKQLEQDSFEVGVYTFNKSNIRRWKDGF
jgi:hypothetical protein